MVVKKIKEKLNKLKLSERKKKPKPIKNRNNKLWKDLDKLRQEELEYELGNLRMKNSVQAFLDKQKKKRYDVQENRDEEEVSTDQLVEEEKERKLAAQSNEFWANWNKQRKQNPFFDSDDDMGSSFGKKQKKDIKGMIKKILLYGGLPTLVVVSLGILSNKKFGKGKIKKSSKIKVSEEEKLFKQVFVKKLKEIVLKRKQNIEKMPKDSRNNLIQTNKRQLNRQQQRNIIADAAMNRMKQLKIKKPSSNPQQAVTTPPKSKALIETIQERMKKKIPSNKIFIKIERMKKNWYLEEEKNSNYYISKGDGKIYNKKGVISKYIYTEKDGLGLRTNNQIIPFIKTEQLKKV